MHNYDIIILSETWLHSGISDNEYIDDRYCVYRCDRDRVGSGRGDGGGVLVAIRRELGAAPRALHAAPAASAARSSPLIDYVLVELRTRDYCCVIGATYIPPNLNQEEYAYFLQCLSDSLLLPDVNEFILIGDFNIPTIEWKTCDNNICMEPGLNTNFSTPVRHLINFMSSLNCFQYNHFKNKNNRILDLCFSNIIDCTPYFPSHSIVPIDGHHPPFYVIVNLNKYLSILSNKPHTQHNYNKADYALIISELDKVKWDDLFHNKSASEAVAALYDVIFSVIKNHVPSKVVKKTCFPVWFSPALIHIFKDKKRSWIKWKKFQNVSDYEIFSIYRLRFQRESRNCYRRYMEKVENSIKDNIKYFWTYIKNRKTKNDMPKSLTYKNITKSEPTDICNLFSEFFYSVYEPSSLDDKFDIVDMGHPNNDDSNIHSIYITRDSIVKELSSLDISKGAGTDNIPPVFFKSIRNSIAYPLQYVFNRCLREGIFPDVWKTARIVPVHKGGSTGNVENYRPISILPVLAKLFERLVHNVVYPELHRIIIPEQHGFVKRRSTNTNLLVYTSYLFKSLDTNKQTDSVCTDFRKAFDRVDHRLLLEKLAFNGIRGNLWRWFCSYVTNRTQKVVIKGFESSLVSVSSGVPQGSILGPLLFVIFINDVHSCFKFCKYLLYADDLKIYHTISNLKDVENFQRDLDSLTQYCTTNKLSLSINKCKSITFTKKKNNFQHTYTLCGIQLESVDYIRDLGIILDKKLHLDIHVDNIISKAYKMYGFAMRSSTDFTQTSTYICLYRSLIRSQLEYAVAVWNPYYHKYIDALESIQKKFLKVMYYKCYRNTLQYNKLLEKYNLLTLKNRRVLLESMFLYNLCHNQYDCVELHNKLSYKVPHRTHCRNAPQLFYINSCRTNAGKRSPLCRITNMYNTILNSIDMFAHSHDAYKKYIHEILVKL